MHIREKYKIVAFCTLVKYRRTNSCISKKKSKHQLAREFGMCYNSFTKYFNLCKKRGLLRELKENWQFISLPEVVKKLELHLDKHCRWTEWDEYKEISFKTIYQKIVDSPVFKNFRQQQYKIEKKQIRLERVFSNSPLSVNQKLTIRVAKEASRMGMTFEEYIKRLRESLTTTIVSGKNHVANLIGYSATYGSKWLRKMEKEGVISRKIIKQYSELPVNHASFDLLRQEGKKAVPTDKGFLLFLGSSITLTLK